MPPTGKRSLWQRIRRPFRWCRICLLSLTLALLGGLIWWDAIGLPAFVTTRIVAGLRARGVSLKFDRLRLRWIGGLVADSVNLALSEHSQSGDFSAREVTLKPDWRSLWSLRLEITSLSVREGHLTIPLVSSNEPPARLVVDRIQTDLRLLPGDQWELDRFEAESLGAKVSLRGTLTNASAVQNWMAPSSSKGVTPTWQNYLRETVRVAGLARFSQPPLARLNVRGDARDPAGITADLSIDAHNANTARGRFESLLLTATFNRATEIPHEGKSELTLVLDRAQTPWMEAGTSRLHLYWIQSLTNPLPAEVKWEWDLQNVGTPWGKIPNARFTGRTVHSKDDPSVMNTDLALDSGTLRSEWVDFGTNHFSARMIHSASSLVPQQAEWLWMVTTPESRWGHAQRFELSGRLVRAPGTVASVSNPDWAWWSLLEPYTVDWSLRLNGVTLTNVPLNDLSMTGQWQAPNVVVDQVRANLGDRSVEGSATINVGTRQLLSRWRSDVDLRQLFPLLGSQTRQWTEPLRWTLPPRLDLQVGCVLPAWTNAHPDLRAEVVPTLAVAGNLGVGEMAYGDLSLLSIQSRFAYSNDTVRLPDLTATRPEGRAEFDLSANVRDGSYHCVARSGIDPLSLRPLLGGKVSQVLDLFQLSSPPQIEGELWGRWSAPKETSVLATVRITNMVFRGEAVDLFSTSLLITNGFLLATNVDLRSGTETASGPALGFDFASGILTLTNGVSTLDPQRVLRCINPILATNLSYYRFHQPPHARVNGWIEVRHGRLSDLHFNLSGGPFSYWKFNVPRISGSVALVNEHVAITNLAADFYGGKLTGDIAVASTATSTPDIHFALQTTDTDLHQLMTDISSPTNRLEGILTGELTVTKANAGDWGSWNGFGNARLRDGYLWDIPLFGIFTPVFSAIVPGLGQSRMSGGAAGFFITNSVIHTRDLQIRSPAMRLAYRGTIDFDYRVDARVEAQLLHDMWVVGPLVSLVFTPLTKLLEYKVTGTLYQPQLEPLLIPKPLQFPLHPWRTLKEMFTDDKPDKPPEPAKPPP